MYFGRTFGVIGECFFGDSLRVGMSRFARNNFTASQYHQILKSTKAVVTKTESRKNTSEVLLVARKPRLFFIVDGLSGRLLGIFDLVAHLMITHFSEMIRADVKDN